MTLLVAPREGEFAWHEVSIRVNRVANDDAQLLLPITDEQRAAEQAAPPKRAPPRKPTAMWGCANSRMSTSFCASVICRALTK